MNYDNLQDEFEDICELDMEPNDGDLKDSDFYGEFED